MINVVPRMHCVTYWLVTYTRTKRKDRPFFFLLKFLRKKITIFTINNWKSAKMLLFDVPEHTGYSSFEFPERSGHSFFECPEHSGNSDKVLWVYWAIRHSNKKYPEHSRSSNKEYPVCSRTSNNNHFVDFQLPIVKNCDFFLRNFSIKMKGLLFLFILV